MKKKLLAIGVACGLSFNIAAEDPLENVAFAGTADILVVETSAPIADTLMCSGDPRGESADCWAVYRAVLLAHVRKRSVIHGHGTWT